MRTFVLKQKMLELNMRKLLFLLPLMLLTLSFVGCKKCKNEDPRARIVNNGTDKVSVQIMTTGGNTVNINNIMPGTCAGAST